MNFILKIQYGRLIKILIFLFTFLFTDKFTGSCYAQWQIQTSGTNEHLYSICFTGTNNQTGYAVGHNGVVIKTTNLGVNWTHLNIPTLWNYHSVFFTNPENGWIVGFEVFRTSNGGQDWTKVITNPEIAGFKVQFFDSENGWILGLKVNTRLRIWKTTDSGNNWDTSTLIMNSVISDPMDMHFPSVETGFISGGNTNSFIAKTITSGKSWFYQNIPSSRYISGINFKDNLTGWAITDSGNILKTTNGGTNWYKSGTVAYGGRKIYYRNINNNDQLWIIGANGSILYSGNLGNSWQSVTFNSSHSYEDLTFSGNNQTGIHIVGNNGMIIYSENTGGVNINETSNFNPKFFTLYQNYPNPFNPNTVIKYSLEKSGFVTLKIYDVMGKVIKILVNEFKKIGKYEVNFNSENIASGVYFYKIKSGNYTETRRMLFIK